MAKVNVGVARFHPTSGTWWNGTSGQPEMSSFDFDDPPLPPHVSAAVVLHTTRSAEMDVVNVVNHSH